RGEAEEGDSHCTLVRERDEAGVFREIRQTVVVDLPVLERHRRPGLVARQVDLAGRANREQLLQVVADASERLQTEACRQTGLGQLDSEYVERRHPVRSAPRVTALRQEPRAGRIPVDVRPRPPGPAPAQVFLSDRVE